MEDLVFASVIFINKKEDLLLGVNLPYVPNLKEGEIIDLTVDVIHPDKWSSDINRPFGDYKVISIKQSFTIVYSDRPYSHHDIEVLVEKVEEVV